MTAKQGLQLLGLCLGVAVLCIGLAWGLRAAAFLACVVALLVAFVVGAWLAEHHGW